MDYTKTHFAEEEAKMESVKYPNLKEHCRQHWELMEKVNDFHRSFNDGEALLTVEVIGFLVDWLKNHIHVTDKQYAPFMR